MDFGFHAAFCDIVPTQNALAFYWVYPVSGNQKSTCIVFFLAHHY